MRDRWEWSIGGVIAHGAVAPHAADTGRPGAVPDQPPVAGLGLNAATMVTIGKS
jgi:hypothetical protein